MRQDVLQWVNLKKNIFVVFSIKKRRICIFIQMKILILFIFK